MRSTRAAQIIVILLISGLIAFIYFNSRNTSSALVKSESGHQDKGSSAVVKGSEPFDFDAHIKEAKTQLKKEQVEEIEKLEKQYKDQPGREVLTRLAEKYDKLNLPSISGYYYLKLAQSKKDDAAAWSLAGKKFYQASGMFAGTPGFYSMIQESISAYDKAIELNPRDLDAKADQAANLMDLGQGPPMKPIGMLKEILQVDSNNRKAILYLGIFSMKSGQFPKGIVRFQKLVSMDPANSNYHRYLGDAYIKNGDKAMGIKELEKSRDLTKDPAFKAEMDDIIKNEK